MVGAASVALGGDAPLELSQPDGTHLLSIPPGEVWRVSPVPGAIAVMSGGGLNVSTVAEARVAPSDSTGMIRVNGRP